MKTSILMGLGALALTAQGALAGVCPGTGDCYTPHVGVGCADASCCLGVCAVDAFCCNSGWDSLCASEAAKLCLPPCPGQCVGDLNDSGVVDGADLGILLGNWLGAGCGDLNVDGVVNGADLGILLGGWGTCPVACGSPSAGDCCASSGTPYCNDLTCCTTVCNIDPFCCNTVWDAICADEAQEYCEVCPACGNNFAGDCCSANGSRFCDDEACCNAVCNDDPFCCSTQWDSICADEANAICAACPSCGNQFTGDCLSAHNTPFCNDASCCQLVCASDSFCCETQWDGLCVDAAEANCYFGCANGSGNCYVAHEALGCNDFDCCFAVCSDDPFCCQTEWDVICVDQAFDVCGNCGSPAAGNCFQSNGSPGCNDDACCEPVCADDPFCCNNTWDGICADEAAEVCGNPACPGSGSCLEPHGTPGCNDGSCCELVCAADPFCCNTSWDSFCVDEVSTFCN